MKQILILFITSLLFTTMSCAQNTNKKLQTETAKQDANHVSYAIGIDVGSNLKNLNIEDFDIDKFVEGLKAMYYDDGKIDLEANRTVIQDFMTAMQAKRNEKNKAEGKAFLEKNRNEPGVITTESGLQYKIEREGTGEYPAAESEIEVTYRGTLIDGREFDANEKINLSLNRVIKGWTEGIQKISEGGKIKLFIPEDLAYGERSFQGTILEPYSTLIFEIELLKIIKK
ncbi:MAG: FKBP-type peptidyl-prolyl cis-trans isomerase [Prevotellaceae bacterium]|jgi:FKBP-type peptidyl-prolyl cis-trans isomerase|nr:FKBP-type peptidyl-prolyl cis-trans isomerase [Prevotellaceae bacterium]